MSDPSNTTTSESRARDVRRRLTLNTASNMGRYVLMTAITLYLTPFMVRTLGDSLYGFWALIMSLVGYASILEMGVQPAVVKLVGQYRARGENQRLCEMVTAAFVFFVAVGVLAAALAVFLLPSLVQNHVEDLRQLGEGTLLFVLIGVDALIMYMNYLVTGVLYGSQRYHEKNLIDVGGQVLNAVILVLFLERGGLVVVVLAKIAMDVVVSLAAAGVIHRVVPELGLSPRHLRWGSFRELMGFGSRVFVSATTTRMAQHAPPIIISTALSSAATAIYVIPGRLISYAQQIGWALSASFMPMFSELDSQGEHGVMRDIYLSCSRYIFLALMPFLVGIFVYGTPFVALWIGPDYAEKGAGVMVLLTATALVDSAQPLLWRFFVGIGQLNVLIWISAVTSLLTIVASVLLVDSLGIDGVALGVLGGALLGKTLLAVQSARQLQIAFPRLLATVHLRPVLSGGVMYLCAAALVRWLGTDTYIHILLGALLSSAVFVVAALRISLNRGERTALREQLARRLPNLPGLSSRG